MMKNHSFSGHLIDTMGEVYAALSRHIHIGEQKSMSPTDGPVVKIPASDPGPITQVPDPQPIPTPLPDPPPPPPDPSPVSVDDAVKGVLTGEATLTADEGNVASIEASIATATAPLGAAQAKVKDDINNYNAAVDVAVKALLASKRTPIA